MPKLTLEMDQLSEITYTSQKLVQLEKKIHDIFMKHKHKISSIGKKSTT
jgi:hypothetical protein